MKKLVVALSLMMVMIVGAACTQKTDSTQTSSSNQTQTSSSNQTQSGGTVTISGSTSVEKIMVAIADEYMALNPDTTVTYEAIGSSAGIKNGNEGNTQIGTASRGLKESEVAYKMTATELAFDGIAVVAHPENGVKGLTMDQIKSIYKGDIKNWSEVGGKDAPIVVVSRESGSGTRGAFEEIIGFEKELTQDATIAEGNGNVQASVATNPNSIGYISFSTMDDTIKPLYVNETEPKVENVLNGKYPVSRPFIMVYHEKNLTAEGKKFAEFVLSADAQKIVEKNGGIPVK